MKWEKNQKKKTNDIKRKTKFKKKCKRNTTNEGINPAIKREISRHGDNTYHRND